VNANELLSQTIAVNASLAKSLNATLTLVSILGDRVAALELHAQGMSFEDMVEGRLPQVGLTDAHREALEQVKADLEAATKVLGT